MSAALLTAFDVLIAPKALPGTQSYETDAADATTRWLTRHLGCCPKLAHALDRLLRAVAGFRFQIFVDLPQRRLTMVADPRRGATLAHHVPARLVLAVVMAAADREVVFGPNDLRAGLEAAGG